MCVCLPGHSVKAMTHRVSNETCLSILQSFFPLHCMTAIPPPSFSQTGAAAAVLCCDIFVVCQTKFRLCSAVLAGLQRKNVRNAQLKEEEEKIEEQLDGRERE